MESALFVAQLPRKDVRSVKLCITAPGSTKKRTGIFIKLLAKARSQIIHHY
jgi:hypothetical protein